MQTGRARTIMLQGTASDVGKSVVTTALCRVLKQDGWEVAPYKSQNMALNSYVTLDGKEIGRAQGVQAEACEIPATTDMNPILIKPMKEMNAQIVVHGKPYAQLSAQDYRRDFLPFAKQIVVDALERLRARHDVIVIEGAGSPAEINLKDRDIVNMRLAAWADAPVLLVADIDRGGVFASIVGTLELLEPEERARVKGFIINKFRGDKTLLQPGLDWLEQRTGIPVLGVLPFLPQLDIEAEDSMALVRRQDPADANRKDAALDIAVIRYPRISNFTDFDPFAAEPDVRLRYVQTAAELGEPDIVILPGTKNTLGDLEYLRSAGLDDAIAARVAAGCRLAGICGGYQMLGRKLRDPHGVESGNPDETADVAGLGYLPLETVFYPEKRTERASGEIACSHPAWARMNGIEVAGYEIHMGQTAPAHERMHRLMALIDRSGNPPAQEGAVSEDGRIWGTYLHGIFHNDRFRHTWLNHAREEKGLVLAGQPFVYRDRQQLAFDRIAEAVRQHLDMEKINEIIGIRKA
ncbi:cobyric acid synthase [Paenibacillus sp. CECT 9249]|uniref:cobyric acid synthase n=1 Tax=Paenibacillus sp. CECT 9249 TaxID=2845385 RepID=UPI001E49BB1F|nr:cobyric acid synthase [Paenibacillus sp. CECT 9249]